MTIGELIALIKSWFNKIKLHAPITGAHIVKFQDGLYGIRRRDFVGGWEFFDLANRGYWWTADSKYIKDCKGTQEKVTRIFEEKYGDKSVVKDPGTPV